MKRWHHVVFNSLLMILVATWSPFMRAQSNAPGTLQGAVVDPKGQALAGAAIIVHNESNTAIHRVATNNEGRFSINGLADGSYTVEIVAPGFAPATRSHVRVGADASPSLSVTLTLASVAEEVTVSAEDNTSLAAQLSPVKALLDAGSARTEITNQFIREFTSPVTDFTEIMQTAPGTFSVSPNGVGLGDSDTSFRGFIDGDYTVTYDGIPFEDTNNPTHHSWAYFPGPSIGGVDFDRSPGTASDIGPANYGGSIHFLSPQLPPDRLYRLSDSYGSWNTNLIDGEFNSGLFGGKNPKANLWFDAHHMSSDGYQTFNYQTRTAEALKFTYKFSDKTYLTVDGNSVILDANTPNNNVTAAQIAQHGNNYLMDNTEFLPGTTTYDPFYYKFYFNHIPTDFEYVDLNKDLGHGWKLDVKPYVYAYSNHQYYQNSDTVTDTSAIDKMNQYFKFGEVVSASSASKYGVFRTGFWYEYASTNRFQIKSNPVNELDEAGIAGINFHENFWTNSAQPFAEYQLVAIPKWTITLGLKDAYYNMSLKQYADNGHIVGNLNGAPYVTNDGNFNSWLPSFEANYRIKPNWSAYVQYGMGSQIPPSSVYDINQTSGSGASGVTVLPKPQVSSTYQGGTVVKLDRVSFDADYYYIHFENSYVAAPVANSYTYTATPPSNTTGVEAEGNIAVTHKLSVFLNGTLASAKYVAAAANPVLGAPATPSLWVAGAPHDTETEGVTYQDRNWSLGFFNKRVGSQWNDNTDANGNLLHQAIPIAPFSVANLFLNYTLKNGSKWDQSKIRFSVNNLFNNNNNTLTTAANPGTAANPYAPNGGDILTLVPGRSVMVTFQLGFGSKGR
ncbi:TonB-dependent receptor [Acidicapsa acidisoli]|uniref:TonB-dependent receptor n=1 Tax=Acidicapsa acidisoli TaxID=1615681 RepID=UPI0021E02716|nr:TonB-dependent receptor [Acidicapsa acidisoli]